MNKKQTLFVLLKTYKIKSNLEAINTYKISQNVTSAQH